MFRRIYTTMMEQHSLLQVILQDRRLPVNKDGLAAGTYYIRVNTYYSSEWAPYTLADSLFVPTQANDVEPNGTAAQSLTLPLNGLLPGIPITTTTIPKTQ